MGNDLKSACRFSMGKNNMFRLAVRAVAVDCICLFSRRITVFKPAESFSAEMGIMIDWAVIEIVQRNPVRNSFTSCVLWKSSYNVYYNTIPDPGSISSSFGLFV